MNNKEQEKEIEDLVLNYAKALNNADSKLIAEFYTIDGILMPDGHNSLSQPQLLKTNSTGFFKKVKFQIAYQIADIAIEGSIALVTARALTKSIELSSNTHLEKTSRDLFVLRMENGQWKILRYLFNNLLS